MGGALASWLPGAANVTMCPHPVMEDAMPDDDKEKRNKTRKERDPRVPPTGAKTNSAVEPDADYELESGAEIDADDGALEDNVKKAGVPPTGAKTNSAV